MPDIATDFVFALCTGMLFIVGVFLAVPRVQCWVRGHVMSTLLTVEKPLEQEGWYVARVTCSRCGKKGVPRQLHVHGTGTPRDMHIINVYGGGFPNA